MNKLSTDPTVSLFTQLAQAQAQAVAQPARNSFLNELNAARGEVLRFSVTAAPTGLARKSPMRALELRN